MNHWCSSLHMLSCSVLEGPGLEGSSAGEGATVYGIMQAMIACRREGLLYVICADRNPPDAEQLLPGFCRNLSPPPSKCWDDFSLIAAMGNPEISMSKAGIRAFSSSERRKVGA